MEQAAMTAPEEASTPAAKPWCKTIPTRDEFEWADEIYDDRMLNWAKPQAEFFGTFYDWSGDDVNWLLVELANGFCDDCGDNHFGFASACDALQIAQVCNTAYDEPKLPAIFDLFFGLLDALAWQHNADETVVECEAETDKATRITSILREGTGLITVYEKIGHEAAMADRGEPATERPHDS